MLVATTGLSLRLLAMNPAVGPIVLVDGSCEPDPTMRDVCSELGVTYHHEGRELSYVRAYNVGWQGLDEPYIGLMANDIIPHPLETLTLLLDWIERPDVGCTFPYLVTNRTAGGDEVQRVGFAGRGSISCEPTSMTLNLNVFKRSVLEEIGGLDESYLFGFAEPILLIKIRKLGYRAVMVGGTRAFHYDQLTKELGESTLRLEQHREDAERWSREYPDYASSKGLADTACWRWPLATTTLTKVLWRLCGSLPWFAREHVRSTLLWLEPRLTRYPARLGRAGRTPADR
jgi:GT2 family glycosyltransferase